MGLARICHLKTTFGLLSDVGREVLRLLCLYRMLEVPTAVGLEVNNNCRERFLPNTSFFTNAVDEGMKLCVYG